MLRCGPTLDAVALENCNSNAIVKGSRGRGTIGPQYRLLGKLRLQTTTRKEDSGTGPALKSFWSLTFQRVFRMEIARLLPVDISKEFPPVLLWETIQIPDYVTDVRHIQQDLTVIA